MSEQVTEAQVIRKSVLVDATPEEAFRVFTDEIGTWWPRSGPHSVSGDRLEDVVLEGGVGGRLFERATGGEEIVWGEITLWDPPHQLSFTWHPGREAETGQAVELRFAAEGARTRVDLVHRGWERLGERAAQAIASYDTGWDFVLGECYAGAAGGRGYAGGAAGARSGT
jgi:uncharacterized protein YndB with AHSA1/START domain